MEAKSLGKPGLFSFVLACVQNVDNVYVQILPYVGNNSTFEI